MGDVAIRVEGLGKRYRLGERMPYRTLRETLARAAGTGARRLIGRRGPADSNPRSRDVNYIWALKEVSLQVRQGEAVAILGVNGSGKSTLLRILARVTEPTRGRAEIRGRVGAVLEVGTGFHPELTGRENVYLSGALLGFRRREIQRSFDDIVGFAGVERFIDTPVKHYSSGMYVRLAFAIAAYFVPEVLLLDEVLAVGDIDFRQACYRRMSETLKSGTTVLLVTHDPAIAERWCSRAIWLEEGRVLLDGPSAAVVGAYLSGRVQ